MKILLGMSGGIDSSVAALLLKEQGYDVYGITMCLWKQSNSFSGSSCFSETKKEDLEKCRQICNKLNIPHSAIDISDLFESNVMADFRKEYLSGRTPNPCVVCNSKIKFGALINKAKESGLDFDLFATGHYANIKTCATPNGKRYFLERGKDTKKDQSYFLYRLSQDQLSQTVFPLGQYTKEEIRKIDISSGFHPSDMGESQDFYSGKYSELLRIPPKEGLILDVNGNTLGKHNGYWNYTIGQRKGLGVSAAFPLYVVDINSNTNTVILGSKEKTETGEISATNIVWGKITDFNKEIKALGKVRSTGEPQPCTVIKTEDGIKAIFENPILTPPAGQSLVIYDNEDAILCGGIIK